MDIKVKDETLLDLFQPDRQTEYELVVPPKGSPGDPWYDGVPNYLVDVYDWAYVNPKWAGWLDRCMVVHLLLFGNDARLMQRYLDAIQPGMKVWQVAHVYGDLVQRVADRVGPKGEFHLTDVTPIQLEHACNKLAGFSWSRVIRADAGTFDPESDYDLICCFFLLHEVPEEKKRQIVEHLLECLTTNGKLLFVDYHRPAWWQPVRWILMGVNAWLEPFADALWQHEIRDYASHPEQFTWCKQTLFGGTYQAVWVERSG